MIHFEMNSFVMNDSVRVINPRLTVIQKLFTSTRPRSDNELDN